MTDLGDVSKVLGMNVTRDRENGTITVDEKDYMDRYFIKLINEFRA